MCFHRWEPAGLTAPASVSALAGRNLQCEKKNAPTVSTITLIKSSVERDIDNLPQSSSSSTTDLGPLSSGSLHLARPRCDEPPPHWLNHSILTPSPLASLPHSRPSVISSSHQQLLQGNLQQLSTSFPIWRHCRRDLASTFHLDRCYSQGLTVSPLRVHPDSQQPFTTGHSPPRTIVIPPGLIFATKAPYINVTSRQETVCKRRA